MTNWRGPIWLLTRLYLVIAFVLLSTIEVVDRIWTNGSRNYSREANTTDEQAAQDQPPPPPPRGAFFN